jgi:hypothetical protein
MHNSDIGNLIPKLYSERFDTESVSNLSLFLFPNNYLLLAKDTNGIVIATHQIPVAQDLVRVLQEDELLNLTVPLKVFNYRASFCLVPGLVFDLNNINSYLYFADPQDVDSKHVFQTNLESNNYHLISSIDLDLTNLLEKDNRPVVYHYGGVSFLSYSLQKRQHFLNQEILICACDGFFFLAAFAAQELVLFNCFDCLENQDLLRYLFGIVTKLGFDQAHCRITMFGNSESCFIDEKVGKEYFSNFNTATPTLNQQYSRGLSSFPNLKYFDTFWEFT